MNDFELYLKENNMTEEQLNDWMVYMDKYYYTETKSNIYYKKKSNTHGVGLFAINNIKKNKEIGIASINDKRTPLARYINHSKNPNVEFLKVNENIIGYSLKDIQKNKELLVNYRHKKL
jgi:SET domain-containing protein